MARAKTLGSLYYSHVESSYVSFLSWEERLHGQPDNFEDPNYFADRNAYTLAGIQVIVFAAMCVEACAYDFAATHLGDNFVVENLEKVDPIAKWVLSLRLISAYDLPKSGALYGAMRRLFAARNKLVHIKSEELDFEAPAEQVRKLEREGEQLRRDVHDAFRAVALLSLTLQQYAPPAAYHLPLRFFPPSPGSEPLPASLQEVVAECRRLAKIQVGA